MLRDRPWQAWGTYTLSTIGLYTLASRAPLWTPLKIHAGRLDELVPLLPPAAFVYVTYLLLVPALILLARNRDRFNEVLAVTLACGLLNALVFNLLPTEIAGRSWAPAGSLLALVQRLDTPRCALPSGHVALPASIAAAAVVLWRRGGEDAGFWRRAALILSSWTIALAASTLLTKQHFVPDVATGLGFGVGVAVCGLRILRDFESGGLEEAPRGLLNAPTLLAFLLEWSVIVLAGAAAMRYWCLPVAIAAGLVIATRQHAILILYHDGVHGLAARARRLNDFLINLFVGVPLFLPLHLYRALHINHHRYLATERDPERTILYRGQPWKFRPLAALALGRQLLGDLFVWNAIRTTVSYVQESRPGKPLRLPTTRAYPELVVQFVCFYGALAASLILWPGPTMRAILLWYVPYLTVLQVLMKLRSFAEHTTEDADPSCSLSWSPGLLGRLTIWPYNINYHREHHSSPAIPWNELPAAFPSGKRRPGRELVLHLWKGTLQ
jgi:fatty acid desaturase